jgi:peroxiredoxin/cold shock CspA family protein
MKRAESDFHHEEHTLMTTNLQVNDQFPDIALPNHQNEVMRLSHFTRPSLLDKHLGFLDGYPLILVFFRGFFCPRDQQQMRQLVEFQRELTVNYGKLVAVSADPPLVQAAFRAGLGAQWTFLSDERRVIIKQINILDETEGEYAYRAQPYTFILQPDLRIYKIYNGWYFVRIPQQEWENGVPSLGANGLPVAQGVVRWFDLNAGVGVIARDGSGDEVFFHFTALPGQGYRTIRPDTPVKFELVEGSSGMTARNIQQIG